MFNALNNDGRSAADSTERTERTEERTEWTERTGRADGSHHLFCQGEGRGFESRRPLQLNGPFPGRGTTFSAHRAHRLAHQFSCGSDLPVPITRCAGISPSKKPRLLGAARVHRSGPNHRSPHRPFGHRPWQPCGRRARARRHGCFSKGCTRGRGALEGGGVVGGVVRRRLHRVGADDHPSDPFGARPLPPPAPWSHRCRRGDAGDGRRRLRHPAPSRRDERRAAVAGNVDPGPCRAARRHGAGDAVGVDLGQPGRTRPPHRRCHPGASPTDTSGVAHPARPRRRT